MMMSFAGAFVHSGFVFRDEKKLFVFCATVVL